MSNQLSGFDLVLKGKFTAANTTGTTLVLTGGSAAAPSLDVDRDLILVSPATAAGTASLASASNIFVTGFSVITATANTNDYNYFVLRSNNDL